MRWLFNDRSTLDLMFEVGLAILCLFVPPPPPGDATLDTRRRAATIVASIQRADYEGDRAALQHLRDALTPLVEKADRIDRKTFGSRLLYWRGFAMWRRAINGFNEMPVPQDIEADLTRAAADFHEALARDPAFVDAKAAEASCVVGIGALHRGEPRGLEMLKQSWALVDEALVAAPDNPRLAWVHGMNVWYAPPARGGGQEPAIAIYTRGLEHARAQRTAHVADSLEPTWGEPELLANLAWAKLNQKTPDVAAAERLAQEALAKVPHWHYVRDILLVQIRQAAQAAAAPH